MQAEISLNTETSTLRQKFRLHAMFRDEQTKAAHRPHSERMVANSEVTRFGCNIRVGGQNEAAGAAVAAALAVE
jgi:5-keto 4-deoxyuronate isomerase